MGTQQHLQEADAIHILQKHYNSATLTLPKQAIENKLGIEVEDLHGEYVNIDVDTERHGVFVHLPEPQE